jgi:hypothetical protein
LLSSNAYDKNKRNINESFRIDIITLNTRGNITMKRFKIEAHDSSSIRRFCKSVAWAEITDHYTRLAPVKNSSLASDLVTLFTPGQSPEKILDVWRSPKLINQPSAQQIDREIKFLTEQKYKQYKSAMAKGSPALIHFRNNQDRMRKVYTDSIFFTLNQLSQGNQNTISSLTNTASKVNAWASLSIGMVTLLYTPSAQGIRALAASVGVVTSTTIATTIATTYVKQSIRSSSANQHSDAIFLSAATNASREGALTFGDATFEWARELIKESGNSSTKVADNFAKGMAQGMRGIFQGFSLYFATTEFLDALKEADEAAGVTNTK